MPMEKASLHLFVLCTILFFSNSCTPTQPMHTPPGVISINNRLTLTVWLPEQDNGFYSKLTEKFEQVNPDINVLIVEIPESEYVSSIEDTFKNGKGPDIALLTNPRWLFSGFFLPLDKEIQQFKVPVNDFNQGAWHTQCTYNNQTFCLGTYTSAYVLFYNKEIFNRSNLPYLPTSEPLSISVYSALLQRFNIEKSDGKMKTWGTSFPLPFLWLPRQTHLSSDGRQIYRFINDEPTINAYQILSTLCRNGIAHCDSTGEGNPSENLDLFTSGRLATLIAGTQESIPAIERAGINWGASVVPDESSSDGRWTTAWTDGFGVLRTTQQPDLAKKYLAFLGNWGSVLRAEAGEQPLNMAIGALWAGEDTGRKQVIEVTSTARQDIFIPDSVSILNLIRTAFSQSITTEISVKTAFDEAAPAMQKVLDQSWYSYDQLSQNQGLIISSETQ